MCVFVTHECVYVARLYTDEEQMECSAANFFYRSAVWQKYEQDTGAFLPKSECQIGKNMGKI